MKIFMWDKTKILKEIQKERVFEGKRRLILTPGKSLDHWGPGQSHFEPYIYRSSREELDKRYNDFSLAAKRKGLKVEDKDMVCTDQWVNTTGDVIQAFVYPETFRNFATTNLGFTYSDGKEAPKITLPKFYGVGVCGLLTVEGSYKLFGIRPDGRVDTVPAGFLEQKDLFQENPIVYAFKREGRKNSLEPESAEEKDVLRLDKWRNLSAYFEAEASMDRVLEDYDIKRERLLPQRRDVVYLRRKDRGQSKYKQLVLCSDDGLEEFAVNNVKKLGDRTVAILKRYFKLI